MDEIEQLKDENLRLYRELMKCEPVSPEIQRLQKLLEGVCIPGTCILTSACDEIERLRAQSGANWDAGVAESVRVAELTREVERLRGELVKVYDAIGSERVVCPKCGCNWFVPKQLWGDPRFDCPQCAATAGEGE